MKPDNYTPTLFTYAMLAVGLFPAMGAAQPSATEADPFRDGAWTMVVIPDTQKYVDLQEPNQYPQVFNAMTQWIVDQKGHRNIQLVLHVGDIVHNNTEGEWEMAKTAMSKLDGHVPYVIVGGNHDYGDGGSANNRSTLMNTYFKVTDNPLNDPAHGGVTKGFYESDTLDNTYSVMTAPDGRKLLILALEFAPRQKVVDWARQIAQRQEYRDHTAILLTHAYMEEGPRDAQGNPTAIRSNWAKFGAARHYNPHSYGLAKDAAGNQLTGADAVLDGEELWTNLVSKVGNFEMTLNGHYLDDNDSNVPEGGPATTAMQVDSGSDGQNVYQIVANYQQLPNGGDGYMRLLEFLPDGKTVQIKTYSPTLDRWLTDPRNHFTIELTPVPDVAESGQPTQCTEGVKANDSDVADDTA